MVIIMTFSETVKRHKIMFSALLILLCLLILFLYQYIKWNRYYNEIWVPFIEIAEENGGTPENLYTADRGFYLAVPTLFDYKSNIGLSGCRPYDYDDPDKQYYVDVLIWLSRDGNYCWGIFIDEMLDMNKSITVCFTYINPDTLEILSDDITDEERQIYQLNIEQVESAVNEIREICYPLLS